MTVYASGSLDAIPALLKIIRRSPAAGDESRGLGIPGGILLRLPDFARSFRPRWSVPALALVASLGALLLRLAVPGRGIDSLYDEGVVVGAGWRVLSGQVPFRDFWHLHSPGTAWLVAACFRLFGTSLGVERGVDAAVFAAGAGLVCALASLRSGCVAALAAAWLFALSPCQTNSLRPRDLGLLFVLAALGACLVWLERPERRTWLVAAGALVGAAAWFKQDFAAGTAVALMTAVLARTPARAGERARRGIVLVASALAAFAPVPVALAMQGALLEAWRQAVVFPTTRFAALRSLPVSTPAAQARDTLAGGQPALEVLAAATPVLVYSVILGALVLAVDLLRRREGRVQAGLLGLALLGLFLTARVRVDAEHLLPPLALAVVLLAWWSDPPGARTAWRRATGIAAACVLAAVAAAAGPPGASNTAPADVDGRFRLRMRSLTGADPDFLLAAADVARRTREGEPVFCCNTRHDTIIQNAALFTFVSGRSNPTRYDNLHPGVVTTPEVQREIVNDLEAKHVRVVVLWREPRIPEPEKRTSPEGAAVLDVFLLRTFAPVRAFGRYVVCLRRDGQAALRDAAPAAAPSK